MTCGACSTGIENHLTSLPSIISANVSLLTNKAVVVYNQQEQGPRSIISEIKDLGFECELILNTDTIDIRKIAEEEVKKYKQRFLSCLVLYLPIAFLIWVLPYSENLNSFMINV